MLTTMLIALALTACGTNGEHGISLIRENVPLHPARLSRAEKGAIIKYVRAILDRNFDKDTQLPAIPEIIGYEKVFVTLYNNGKTRCFMRGKADRGQTSWGKEDIASAVKRCADDDRFGEKVKKEEIEDLDFEVTYLYGRRKVDGGKDKLKTDFAPGIHGLEVENGDKHATFKESVPITKQYDFNETIKQLCKKAGLKSDCDQDKDTKFFLYDSISFIKVNKYNVTFETYRQNAIFNAYYINKKLLVSRLGMVHNWFLQNINSNTGRLQYEYFPNEDKYEESGSSEIRLMATSWALAALQNELGGEHLSPIINDMLDYYLKNMRCDVDEEFGDYCVLDIDGGKIANNAFMLLALIEYPIYPNSEDIKKKLAVGLLRQQKGNGAFLTRFNSDGESGKDYYPGEAMLALMKYYQETNDPKYMNAVSKAFPYYRDYWRGNRNTAFVPWNTRAYKILYEVTKDKNIAIFIFEMNDWMVKYEQVRESLYKDEIGGMPKRSPRYSTSVYMEGMNDAYVVALAERDHRRTVRYRDSIRNGMRFVLLTQYTLENSYYLPNIKNSVGGFRYSLIKNNQRIDFAQHAVFAIIKSIHSGVFK
ncbi:MAG: AMMECR1 domain-containing protein [Candidatus Peribacteraceae bacterium]|nr:AMMECR1 domain-containing protein [Candidatus Peribacteraceae bacterium]